MNILITGATGFVGRYVSLHFCRSGFNVTTFSRSPFYGPSSITSIHGDCVYSLNDLAPVLTGIDCIVHLEGRAHIMNKSSAHQSLRSFREVNVDRTLSLASAAAAHGVKKFVYVSTIKVHGESSTTQKPFSLADQLVPPVDPYSISKFEAEIKLKQLSAETDLNLLIVRPPLIYGPGVKGNLCQLLKLISSGVPLPFASLTSNHRSMISLNNLSCFLQRLIESSLVNEVFLVSDGNDISTCTLVQLLAKHLGVHSFLYPVPSVLFSSVLSSFRMKALYERLCCSLVVDSSESFSKLNWFPPDDVFSGLYSMANDFNIRVNS